MQRCPHCEQYGITDLRKACLGPALTTTCRACGKRVGVPWSAGLLAIPAALATALGFLLHPMLHVVLVLAAVVFTAPMWKRVPLVKR